MGEFNSYIEEMDSSGGSFDALIQLCREQGQVQVYKKKQTLPVGCFGLIVQGYCRYTVFNPSENKEYITGFAFASELVGDYPYCLKELSSGVKIETATTCKILQIDLKHLNQFIDTHQAFAKDVAENLMKQAYGNFLDCYRLSHEQRYCNLLRRCPDIVQKITLREIASFLHITPTSMSKIRRKITFGS